MGSNKNQKNKDKWDYDKSNPFGREKSDKDENEETGYKNDKHISAARKGDGLEEYADDDSERKEKEEWNPDDFDNEELTGDDEDDK